REQGADRHDAEEAPLHNHEALEAWGIRRRGVIDEKSREVEKPGEPGDDENDVEGFEPQQHGWRVYRSPASRVSKMLTGPDRDTGAGARKSLLAIAAPRAGTAVAVRRACPDSSWQRPARSSRSWGWSTAPRRR